MRIVVPLLFTFTILTCFTACLSTPPYGEFVKTINFTSLDTFSYKHTLTTGMNFRKSDELLLEELSEQVVVSQLEGRGFEPTEVDADFFAVVKWKKLSLIHI